MTKQISDYDEPDSLRTYRGNAIRMGRFDLAAKAFRRICLLEAQEHEGNPVAHDYYQALEAYEELLREKHGRKQLAGYTRKSLRNKGLIPCLEEWAGSETPTTDFTHLVEHGLKDMTAEAIVLRHPEHFTQKTLDIANKRLADLKD